MTRPVLLSTVNQPVNVWVAPAGINGRALTLLYPENHPAL